MRLGLLLGVAVMMLSAADSATVTFSRHVAPILQAKCEECHRSGGMAPMALVTYQEARPWAKAIRDRVVTRQMPPWHIDQTVGVQAFANDRSLTAKEIEQIAAWVDQGAAEGNPKDLPKAITWPEENGWRLAAQFGAPDIVVKSEPYTVPKVGQDQWWKPVTAVPVAEPRWVRAVEIRPATRAGRRVTHHVLARLIQDESQYQATGIGQTVRGAAGPGMLMEWAVGKNYDVFRPDTGKLLLPGARIWWEVHYHAVGEEIRDHAELAIYLYPKGQEPKYRTYLTMFPGTEAFGSGIDIPPGSVRQVEGVRTLALPARLENFQPHMHLRGKAMKLEAILPDGRREVISNVDRFNFNWMTNYIYADDAAPVYPKGTRIQVTAVHDNTVNNPNNPDAEQWVGFGDRTVDEMAHAWVNVTYLTDEDYERAVARRKPAARQ